MKQLKRLLPILFVLLMTVSVTSCSSDGEPGSQSSHDYFHAFVESDPSYYWVVDMNNRAGAGFDGSFAIRAWTLDGKRMNGMNEYSGKYTIGDGNNRIYVTWDHQSMNTLWDLTSYGLSMSSPSNPSELQYLTFYQGAPDFE